ncbi:hypothetical protein M5K25_000580 [Dendrobium thyrsiflorum]|uniref:Uncharacterized protein n=1 Tax=Dendrobium thyrsiflorum TaxID=117978 RepID=A0ABD0VW45_DENTH
MAEREEFIYRIRRVNDNRFVRDVGAGFLSGEKTVSPGKNLISLCCFVAKFEAMIQRWRQGRSRWRCRSCRELCGRRSGRFEYPRQLGLLDSLGPSPLFSPGEPLPAEAAGDYQWTMLKLKFQRPTPFQRETEIAEQRETVDVSTSKESTPLRALLAQASKGFCDVGGIWRSARVGLPRRVEDLYWMMPTVFTHLPPFCFGERL